MSEIQQSEQSEATISNRKRRGRVFLRIMISVMGMAIVFGWLKRDETQSTVQAGPLPVIAAVPDFTLTSQSGELVGLQDLLGGVWVADFIFTSCAGPCPVLTLRMRSLQNTLIETGRKVKCVSFTVDPETDTPAVLSQYAQKNHANPSYWWFLTDKNEAKVHDLVMKGFLQPISPPTEGSPLIHSQQFMLIDAAGRIRAHYDGMKPATKEIILRDIDKLLVEIPGT